MAKTNLLHTTPPAAASKSKEKLDELAPGKTPQFVLDTIIPPSE
jgi:hypothetical protein